MTACTTDHHRQNFDKVSILVAHLVCPTQGKYPDCYLLLSAVFMLMTFLVFVAYGFVAHGFRRLVTDSDRVQSWLRFGFGFATAFVGLGAKLALSEK